MPVFDGEYTITLADCNLFVWKVRIQSRDALHHVSKEILCSVLIIISILGVVIKYLLNVAFLGWADRICGVGFGLIKGVLIVTVLFIILTTFLAKGAPLIKKSVLAPHVIWISEKMVNVVSKETRKDFFGKLDEFKKAWKIPK